MSFFLFAVALLASTVGAVVGAGGGVIIKPVLDLVGVLPVSTVSFCSGCTALGMALFSLIYNRKNWGQTAFENQYAVSFGGGLRWFGRKVLV